MKAFIDVPTNRSKSSGTVTSSMVILLRVFLSWIVLVILYGTPGTSPVRVKYWRKSQAFAYNRIALKETIQHSCYWFELHSTLSNVRYVCMKRKGRYFRLMAWHQQSSIQSQFKFENSQTSALQLLSREIHRPPAIAHAETLMNEQGTSAGRRFNILTSGYSILMGLPSSIFARK